MNDRSGHPQQTAETAASLRQVSGAGSGRYLAIFEPGSSRVVTLPRDGELVIGRSADVSLRLDDPSVSRRHAKLWVTGGQTFVIDLGSQNGTFVDGELVVGQRALSSGETIEVSQSSIVFHDAAEQRSHARLLGLDPLRARLTDELERALVTGRTPIVFAIKQPRPSDDLGAVLTRHLEGLECCAVDSQRMALVLAPELERDDARGRAEALLASLGAGARVGIARAPDDGTDATTLLGSARSAAGVTPDGTALFAHDATRTITLGSETAFVADAAMLRVYALAERLARADLPVLVHGETGSGKELLALAIHHFSPTRRTRRLVSLNCATFTETLVESELFGHERGAFTGAVASKVGLLEAAAGGTVFLDEVAELTPATQAKLLRALDAKRIMRLGDTVERPIDVRIVAATHRDLSVEVGQGRFRSDLYYRLSGATLWVPPLRDRPRELALLTRRFLDDACRRVGRAPMRITDDAIRVLASHRFPGNVRELRHVLEYVVAAYDDPVLEAWHVEERLGVSPRQPPSVPASSGALRDTPHFRPIEDEVRELESARMRTALAACGGNQRRAAQLISMPLRTFVTKLARYGIKS